MKAHRHRAVLGGCLAAVALAWAAPGHAQHGGHVHGLVRLDVAVEAERLTVELQAPLDSLLGFEHRPRTAAQRQAADAVIQRMNEGASLIRPSAAAQCTPVGTTVESEALASVRPPGRQGDDEHADLDARFEFTCLQPDQLASVEFGFFDAFKRIERIDLQVVGPRGQSKQMLRRPNKLLKLSR